MYTMIKVVDSVSHKQTTNAEGKQFEGENLSLLLANFNKSIQLHLIKFVRKILSTIMIHWTSQGKEFITC